MRFCESLTDFYQTPHFDHVFFRVMLCMTLHCSLLPVSQFFRSAVRHTKKRRWPHLMVGPFVPSESGLESVIQRSVDEDLNRRDEVDVVGGRPVAAGTQVCVGWVV